MSVPNSQSVGRLTSENKACDNLSISIGRNFGVQSAPVTGTFLSHEPGPATQGAILGRGCYAMKAGKIVMTISLKVRWFAGCSIDEFYPAINGRPALGVVGLPHKENLLTTNAPLRS
jgi:hypothetical protein